MKIRIQNLFEIENSFIDRINKKQEPWTCRTIEEGSGQLLKKTSSLKILLKN